jgi:hypothetical protein
MMNSTKPTKNRGEVVVDAVVCEPVSAAKFPANRQKTGNF